MTDGNNHPSGITDQKKVLIKKSWGKFLEKGHLQDLGLHMFDKLFEIIPETKDLFKYDESDPDRKKKLRNHVKLLFDTIAMAVINIDDLSSLTPVIINLGTRHNYYGVKQKYYLTFGECLIHALESALNGDFSKDDKDAWLTFYHWLGGCIVKGMSMEASRQK